ncbi:MAG TPA: type IV pilus secretin PilQ [Candidatus Kapabacteria bacterium]|nr:type IV pilus secretin PilQ [Candidatus Kapabacteria bacterium]
MRIKTLAILALFTLVSLLNLSLEAKAKFAVTDVEYLKGDDFVQLHFITDAIIPIPDLFYPDEVNTRRLVMRIPDVDFVVPKNMFKFDSPVIDTVDFEKKERFVDVNIKLKEKVNYRVFTNQEGLFIEFPNLKRIAANKVENISENKATPAVMTTPISAPKPASSSTPKPVPASTPKPAPTSTPGSTPVPTASAPAAVKNYSPSEIKDFKLTQKDDNRVRFEFMLSGPVDYQVIPVLEETVRLAIDLKNTRAKQFKQQINSLNVKALRGALNTPTNFRVVFDLLYLKNYNVSFNNQNNILVVEFFNTIDKATNEPNQLPKTAPKEMKTEIQPTEIMAQDLGRKSETIETTKPAKPASAPNAGETIQQIKTEPAATIPARQENDFFADEKSQVTKSDLNTLSTADSAKANDQEGQDIDTENPRSFLMQEVGDTKKYVGDPMDFDFINADLQNVILFFSKLSGLSIVIDPGITGTITARMYQVPWDQALQYFLKVNGLDMVREGNLLRIGKVSVLASEAKARRQLRESMEMEGELRTFTRTLSYSQVGQLAPILKKQLSQRGEIITDLRSNTLIISEVPDKIEIIDRLIQTLDAPNPQVSIEARIVETNSNFTKNLGIQWGLGFAADAAYGNQTSLKFPNSISANSAIGGYAVNLPAAGATSGVLFSLGNASDSLRLDLALSAMESQGKGRIISAPRTTTQNNLEAEITQGKSIPVQTSQNNTIQVRYVPAALELSVKPQITAQGTIIVVVDIKNNAPDFANLVLGIPPITTQTIKTTVMVEDGGTIVIGGLYRVEESHSSERTPFLSKIPVLGTLFRNSSDTSTQRELLIFITPRIVKQ